MILPLHYIHLSFSSADPSRTRQRARETGLPNLESERLEEPHKTCGDIASSSHILVFCWKLMVGTVDCRATAATGPMDHEVWRIWRISRSDKPPELGTPLWRLLLDQELGI